MRGTFSVASEGVALPRRVRRRRAPDLAGTLRVAIGWSHLPGTGAITVVGLWLCRAFAGSGIPAGTDTLGFVSRAAANASGDTWLSGWDPSSLGAPRTITLESLLGVITKVSQDPVLTVKLFMLGTIVASGLAAYWLTWRWYRGRVAATVAGLLYMTSQLSLGQTASGHLDVCVVLALAPVVIGLAAEGIESFSLTRSCVLGGALGLLILARPDMALYLVPSAALYIPIRAVAERRIWTTVRNGVLTAMVAGAVAVGLSLYDVVPMLSGVRAEWVSSSGLFTLHEFNARSVPALGSLLGFGREIGYLAFMGRQTWFSHPWISFGVYAALAAIPLAAAWSTLWLRRDARTLYLISCTVLAAFAAKGMYGPLGYPYQWAALHVPLFANLRDPNRWLIGGSVACSVLVGVIAGYVPSLLRWLDTTRPARMLIVAALVCMVALPNAPTTLSGFATLQPTPAQTTLLNTTREGAGPLATVPFDQVRRFVSQGNYQGWEHDLGAESSLWTGRPALADGGWSRPAADTISYLSALLKRRDPAFVSMLAALGVSDVLSFDYAPTAPDLADPSNPLYQQHAITTMPGLEVVRRTSAGALFRVRATAGALSARPLRAVTLGGLSGMSALTRLPGIVPSRWSAEDAASLLHSGGEPGLVAAIRHADLVVIADTSLRGLAVEAASPLAVLGGISSDPQLVRATQTLPPDVATRIGALTDPTAPPPADGVQSTSARFTLAHAQPSLETWAQVRALHDPASVSFLLDGKRIGEVTPVAPVDAGFRWVRITTPRVQAGTHTFRIVTHQSPYGDAYEVDEIRLVAEPARLAAQRELSVALARARSRTAYADDLTNVLAALDFTQRKPGRPVGGGERYWDAIDGARVEPLGTRNAIEVSFPAGRRYHTFLVHHFATPRNWSSRAYAFLSVRGQGTHSVYRVVLDANRQHRGSIEQIWVDTKPGWRELAIPLLSDRAIAHHVVSLRIASDDLARAGRLEVGSLSLSASLDGARVRLPIPAADLARAGIVGLRPWRGRRRGSEVRLSASSKRGELVVRLPLNLLNGHQQLVVPAPARPRQARAPQLHWTASGNTDFSFRVNSTRPFTLVLDRSQDAHWQLNGVPGASPTQAWGALQAWRVPAGSYTGSIFYGGDQLVRLGAIASGLFAAIIAVLLIGWPRRAHRPEPAASLAGTGAAGAAGVDAPANAPMTRSSIGRAWRLPWALALAMLALIPIFTIEGPGAAGNELAVAAILFMAVAVGAAMRDSRR